MIALFPMINLQITFTISNFVYSVISRQETVSRIRRAFADQEDASGPSVYLRGADAGEWTGIEGRLGLQQRRLRRSGVRAEPEPGTAAGYIVQRGLQRQDTLRCWNTCVLARVRLAKCSIDRCVEKFVINCGER